MRAERFSAPGRIQLWSRALSLDGKMPRLKPISEIERLSVGLKSISPYRSRGLSPRASLGHLSQQKVRERSQSGLHVRNRILDGIEMTLDGHGQFRCRAAVFVL